MNAGKHTARAGEALAGAAQWSIAAIFDTRCMSVSAIHGSRCIGSSKLLVAPQLPLVVPNQQNLGHVWPALTYVS